MTTQHPVAPLDSAMTPTETRLVPVSIGTPVQVEFSEAEVGTQTLYVAGVDMGGPGMVEPEYWLSETWPVKCRGDVSTGWKREAFTLIRPAPVAGAGENIVQWFKPSVRKPESGKKFVALHEDGSGAWLGFMHDGGIIDADGDDYSETLKGVDCWAYLPTGFEFCCEGYPEDPITLPGHVCPPIPARSEALDEGAALGKVEVVYCSGLGAMTTIEWFGPVPPHGTRFYAHPSPTPAADDDRLRVAVEAVVAERRRQVDAEGWSEAHDDEHPAGQLARAAGCYALSAGRDGTEGDDFFDCVVDAAIHHSWPWDRSWWKPKDRRSDLVRAGALIVAEIERLDRAALKAEVKG